MDEYADEVDKALKDSQSGQQMSRAGRLAMELAAEKRRLMTELEEVQAENDDLKSKGSAKRPWSLPGASLAHSPQLLKNNRL